MAKDERPWRDDGKRFVAALQDVIDPQCYKDFFESDKLCDAKAKADEAAEKYQRSVLVFDREQCETSYKKVIEKEKKEPEKVLPPRRGRKKVELKVERKVEEPKKKVINKDDYF
jgi:pyruvate/2-oxoacid:ferredoxin oxidoreductase alpha subunit